MSGRSARHFSARTQTEQSLGHLAAKPSADYTEVICVICGWLLTSHMKANSEEPILYLCRKEVEAICREIDTVAVMRDLFALHAAGKTILPDEAYLGWTNANG